MLGRRLLLVSVLWVSACSTSLKVAEQDKELDTSDAGSPDAAGRPPVGVPDAGSDAVPPVVTICGNARCENRVIDVGGTEIVGFACCVDPHLSQCGIVEFGSVCLATNQLGKLDPTCDLPIGSPLGSLPGCCMSDGKCGVYASGLGLGCTEVPIWTALTTCTYE